MRNEQAAADAALKAAEARAYCAGLLQRYTGSSADDCRITAGLSADRDPATTLCEISLVLNEMNQLDIEKKAHRQALAKAGRSALKALAELPA